MATIKEEQIRHLTLEAIKQLGGDADPATVEKVVKEALNRVEESPAPAAVPLKQSEARPANRVIITAFGKNQIGILAGLTEILARHRCDVLDLSQKLLQEFFTIMILVDISNADADFEKLKEVVTARGNELDLKVIIQHEEIFNTMHRV